MSRLRYGLIGLLTLAVIAASSSPADATAPVVLWQIPEAGDFVGVGAGEVDHPTGIATSPASGDVYVADLNNARIDEFTAWGEFVRAFGWGVVASGPDNKPQNERQEIAVSATAGSFVLDFRPSFKRPSQFPNAVQITAPIEYHASAGGVQSALEGLESLGPGDVAVSGPAGGPWTIEFTGKSGDADMYQLEGAKGTLSGGAASVTVKTLQNGANYEVCEPASGDVCREGQYGGASPGELGTLLGVAVDSQGDVYVYEAHDQSKFARVEKFSSTGQFLLMFGGGVDKTTGADVCTQADVEGGDECGDGTVGSGEGEFSDVGFAAYLTVGPDGTVYVGDVNRIDEFTSAGDYKGQLKLPTEGEVKGGAKEGKGTTESLTVDSAGNLYFDFEQEYIFGKANHPNIFKHTPAGWSLFTEILFPQALATDAAGNLYAVDQPSSLYTQIVEFNPQGERLIPSSEEARLEKEAEERQEEPIRFGQVGFSTTEQPQFGVATNAACDIPGGDIYGSYSSFGNVLRAYGAAPDPSLCPPPRRTPSIADQYAASVDSSSAVLRASINAHFWTDTTYYVEYGTAPCALGACARAGAGSHLVSKSNLPVTSGGVLLSALTPGTTYYYRFVAESGGGGPVRGVGGEVGMDGSEGTFTTALSPLPLQSDCSNQVYRTGAGAALPDCRAYELVSPLDKQGSDIVALGNVFGFRAALDRASTSGERLTYSTYGSFGAATSAPYTSQYLASRNPSTGWSNKLISPPRGRAILGAGVSADVEFKTFSPDLCQGWLRLDFEAEPILDPAAVKGFSNIYRSSLCGEGGYEALTTVEPQGVEPQGYFPLELQGTSADGSKAIYVADANLTPEAKLPGHAVGLYDFAGDQPHFVCILPDGTSVTQECAAGDYRQVAASPGHLGRMNDLTGAISRDGTHVFWSSDGKLYLRENPEQPQSAISNGKCTEKEKACTIRVSEKVSEEESAQFWLASADGSSVLFTMANKDLYEYSVTKNKATLIAKGVGGVMGGSEDATRVYFDSTEALAGAASQGQPNLYFHEAGNATSKFVATLSGADVTTEELTSITARPIYRAARVTPDGMHATFMSDSHALSKLAAGYDNTDQAGGETDDEVYVYDAGANGGVGKLVCASCNPTGARPTGRNVIVVGRLGAAARIPTWESELYGSRVLSDDGSRLFFNSYESLVPRDTDGKQDVYEWEAANGKAECDEKGAEVYVSAAAGCLSLISSGAGSQDSEFVDASPSGADVFFTTGASLVPQDTGLIDIYDARVGGGFAGPASPTACEGEACQNPPSPPIELTPASFSFSGTGNVTPAPEGGAAKPGPKAKPLSRKQKLSRALKACRPKPKRGRVKCEVQARKRYGAKASARRARRANGGRATTKGGAR